MTVSADSIAFLPSLSLLSSLFSSHFLLLLLMGLVRICMCLYVEVYIECVCVSVYIHVFEDGSWVSRFPTIHKRWLWVVFL